MHNEMKVGSTFVSKEKIKNRQDQDITSADEALSRPRFIQHFQIQMEKVKLFVNTTSSE